MITGIVSTLLLPETMDRSLEDLSNEPQDDFVQGYADPNAYQLPPLDFVSFQEMFQNPG